MDFGLKTVMNSHKDFSQLLSHGKTISNLHFIHFAFQQFGKNVFGILQSIKQREEGSKGRRVKEDDKDHSSAPSVSKQELKL